MKTILLVEDDPFLTEIYTEKFKQAGFKIITAKDGEVALDKLKVFSPDLVVLDILIPKLDGWEVLKQMRQNPLTKETRVIIISNLNKDDHLNDIKNLGVIKYLLKIEHTPEEIVQTAKEILK